MKPSTYLWASLTVAFALVIPGYSQVEPEASGGDNSDTMMTPPPVSGQAYPSITGAEERSNYLSGGVIFTTSYVDNLYAGSSSPVGETIYSVLPNISLDRGTPRQHVQFRYQTGFTFYQPTSVLNETDQNGNVSYLYRPTQHTTISATDVFLRSSTIFGTTDLVLGAPQPITPGIFAPFAERLSNTATAQFSYQFSPEATIGAAGTLMKMDFPNSSDSTGLYNSDQRGGSAFYNRRITATQYLGVNYQYSLVLAYPTNGEIDTATHGITAFYTIYPNHEMSLSLMGGTQHYSSQEAGFPTLSAWAPSGTASIGWQKAHTNLAASFSRAVTAGGGLLGVYESNSANGSVRWLISHALTVGASANYALNKTETSNVQVAGTGGHAISGTASMDYSINSQLKLDFAYNRLHQSFDGIAAISSDPNSNRETISLAWQFTRPLGR